MPAGPLGGVGTLQGRRGHGERSFVRFDDAQLCELRVIQGLVFLVASRSFTSPMCPAATCSDASDLGFAVHISDLDVELGREEARYREKWRFVEDDGPRDGQDRDPLRPWQPHDALAPGFNEWVESIQTRITQKQKRAPPR